MSWTDERVETLKKMWGEGKSASQIAKELGGVTRNAVIGKVHRLGLSNRNTDDGKGDAAPAKAAPAKKAKPAAKAKPAKEAAPKDEKPSAEAKPKKEAAPKAEPATKDAPEEKVEVAAQPYKRPIITAGKPLPPQPSTDEIDPEALAKVSDLEKQAHKLSLMELTERTCKWPIGDPATEKFWFCGHPAQAGKPYCETHVAVAFQPMSSRRDRRR